MASETTEHRSVEALKGYRGRQTTSISSQLNTYMMQPWKSYCEKHGHFQRMKRSDHQYHEALGGKMKDLTSSLIAFARTGIFPKLISY